MCGNIASQDFRDKAQYVLAKDCAKNALTDTDQMYIEHELGLAAYLNDTTEYSMGLKTPDEWPAERLARSEYWCRAWKKLDGQIKADYVMPKNPPVSRARMTPEERQAVSTYTRQKMLHLLRGKYVNQLRSFFINSYTMPPYDLEELGARLSACSSDKRFHDSLIAEIRLKMSAEK